MKCNICDRAECNSLKAIAHNHSLFDIREDGTVACGRWWEHSCDGKPIDWRLRALEAEKKLAAFKNKASENKNE